MALAYSIIALPYSFFLMALAHSIRTLPYLFFLINYAPLFLRSLTYPDKIMMTKKKKHVCPANPVSPDWPHPPSFFTFQCLYGITCFIDQPIRKERGLSVPPLVPRLTSGLARFCIALLTDLVLLPRLTLLTRLHKLLLTFECLPWPEYALFGQ